MIKKILILAVVTVVFACGSKDTVRETTTVTSSAPAADGAKIYKMNCELCHGVDGKLGANGSKDLSISELSLDERIAIISKGKNAMIAYENILTLSEIKAVAEYTMTLSVN